VLLAYSNPLAFAPVWRESIARLVNRQNVSLRISPKFIELSRLRSLNI